MSSDVTRKRTYGPLRHLYVQTICGVLLGILVGYIFPNIGKSLKPLGDAFINLIRMMIGPIIFCTIVHGIASVGSMRQVGRLGFKVLTYFYLVSTLALIVGMVVANWARPGENFAKPEQIQQLITSSAEKSQTMQRAAEGLGVIDFLMNLIPKTLLSPFATGDLLQVVLVSLLVAFALLRLGENGRPILEWIDKGSHILFTMLNMLVKLAPLGAFGAMAFTFAEFQWEGLLKLVRFMLLFYATAAIFVFGILNLMARWAGFSLWGFLVYVKEELLLILGTSSSETALPGLMQKLKQAGCSGATVGFVVPTGYSFNLDGTNIYMSMAALFVAQANGVELSLWDQLWLLLIAMLTSKGASGVTGAGFVTLVATLQAFPQIPDGAAFLLLGIDRFMSECRSLTNFVGNGVACLLVSRWQGELGTREKPIQFPKD